MKITIVALFVSIMMVAGREGQTRDNNTPNKSKLTLADLQAARSKSNKTFIIDKTSIITKEDGY